MNHPNELRMKQISLDDRYEATEGLVYLTGTQALVRLPMMQRQRDQAAASIQRATSAVIEGRLSAAMIRRSIRLPNSSKSITSSFSLG